MNVDESPVFVEYEKHTWWLQTNSWEDLLTCTLHALSTLSMSYTLPWVALRTNVVLIFATDFHTIEINTHTYGYAFQNLNIEYLRKKICKPWWNLRCWRREREAVKTDCAVKIYLSYWQHCQMWKNILESFILLKEFFLNLWVHI